MRLARARCLWHAASAFCLAALATRVDAQRSNSDAAASACWRFAFGEWSPPLDWSRAGHPGSADSTAAAVRRIRDSVFARDTAAAASNAMWVERTGRGMLLMLYPAWWPAGVEVTFDSTAHGATELLGNAVALMANASQTASRARARAWQVPCVKPPHPSGRTSNR